MGQVRLKDRSQYAENSASQVTEVSRSDQAEQGLGGRCECILSDWQDFVLRLAAKSSDAHPKRSQGTAFDQENRACAGVPGWSSRGILQSRLPCKRPAGSLSSQLIGYCEFSMYQIMCQILWQLPSSNDMERPMHKFRRILQGRNRRVSSMACNNVIKISGHGGFGDQRITQSQAC